MRFILTVLLVLCIVLPPPGFAQVQQVDPLLEEVIYRVNLGKPRDVKALVKRLGNPNAVDPMGWPLLSIAASRNDADGFAVVRTLIELGADVNYGGPQKNYPIIFAVQSGNEALVQYFLDLEADYRVSDMYGMKVVDFARQADNGNITRMIEEKISKDIRRLAMARSQKNLDKLTYDLAYHSCALAYYNYYYSSGQDPIPFDEQDETKQYHRDKASESIAQLMAIFRLEQKEVNKVFFDAREPMTLELENLISNRWRRHKGVGKPGDMEERCERIAMPWEEEYFDKDLLDKRVARLTEEQQEKLKFNRRYRHTHMP